MKKILSFLLTLALLAGLCACAREEAQPSAQTYVFTDDVGREVTVAREINRIVPSSPMAQIVLMAIAPEMFVGLASELDCPELLPQELEGLPYFGSLYSRNDLNVEELALTEAQLIIDIGESKSSVAEDLDALQTRTQIPSVFISTTLETLPQTFRTLGKLLNKEEKAEELALFCQRVYNRTVSVMDEVGENKVKALYVLGEEGLNVVAKDSYHAEVMDLLTDNLAVVDNPIGKGSGNEVTMEQIALWNPEFVIFAPQSIYADVKHIPSWKELDAIVNDNYIEVPDAPHNWMGMPPSVQRYLALLWLTAELYPEYCDYDVKAEIMEYYELFYGHALTDEQYEELTRNAFRR